MALQGAGDTALSYSIFSRVRSFWFRNDLGVPLLKIGEEIFRSRLVMVMLISLLVLPALVRAQETLESIAKQLQLLDREAVEANKFAAVSPILVAAPLDRWVLLRKGKSLCALRFTAFHHEPVRDKIPSTTRDSFFANYDWVYQGDGSQDLSKPNVRSGQGEASKKPNMWRIERGSRFIKCESIKAEWWYPNNIYLIDRDNGISYDPKVSDQPNGLDIALTGWKSIKDINAQDPRLTWRRYDPQGDLSHNNDSPVRIPIDALPGS